MLKYLIRLDDACPTLDQEKWSRMESILDGCGIKPMVGIVPDCKDEKLMADPADPDFWSKALRWQDKGWAIALHGYDHDYVSCMGKDGINPLWERSEFAGVSLEVQKEKIRMGIRILEDHGLFAKYFFAPSHTFDENTLEALRAESKIRIISDTIATKPYRYMDFVFIPQMGGHCTDMRIPGIWTFCLHPNMMSEEDFIKTKAFVETRKDRFTSFDKLDLDNISQKDWFSKILSWVYFKRRSLRGIK